METDAACSISSNSPKPGSTAARKVDVLTDKGLSPYLEQRSMPKCLYEGRSHHLPQGPWATHELGQRPHSFSQSFWFLWSVLFVSFFRSVNQMNQANEMNQTNLPRRALVSPCLPQTRQTRKTKQTRQTRQTSSPIPGRRSAFSKGKGYSSATTPRLRKHMVYTQNADGIFRVAPTST